MSLGKSFADLKGRLKPSDRMPALFIGHGTPLNAIQENQYTQGWVSLGKSLPKPQAIIVISAHWTTRGGTLVDITDRPEMVYDIQGFPPVLYDFVYEPPGAPEIADKALELLSKQHNAEGYKSWGLDHGAWMILARLYPDANVPTFQISVDITSDFSTHYEMGKALKTLRDFGVLVIGSGNLVHNIFKAGQEETRFEWAEEFDARFEGLLENRKFDEIAIRNGWGKGLSLAHPTLEHFLPALSIVGMASPKDKLLQVHGGITMGAVSMRSFILY